MHGLSCAPCVQSQEIIRLLSITPVFARGGHTGLPMRLGGACIVYTLKWGLVSCTSDGGGCAEGWANAAEGMRQ